MSLYSVAIITLKFAKFLFWGIFRILQINNFKLVKCKKILFTLSILESSIKQKTEGLLENGPGKNGHSMHVKRRPIAVKGNVNLDEHTMGMTLKFKLEQYEL